MQTIRTVLVFALGACAVPPLSPTTAERAIPAANQSARAAPSLSAQTLPFSPRASGARAAGGLYALSASGELARLDRRGRLTGIFQTELTSLAVTRDFVCGSESSGRVICARDYHEDATCPGATLAPFIEVALPHLPQATLATRRAGRALCLEHDGQTLSCVAGEAACDRVCLAFPACAPPRCVDPCPPARIL